MQRAASIFIFLFAFYLCAKDLLPMVVCKADITCNIDLSEEDSAEKKKKETKDEDDKWQSAYVKQCVNTFNISDSSMSFYTIRKYSTPFLEINSPPPQRG